MLTATHDEGLSWTPSHSQLSEDDAKELVHDASISADAWSAAVEYVVSNEGDPCETNGAYCSLWIEASGGIFNVAWNIVDMGQDFVDSASDNNEALEVA